MLVIFLNGRVLAEIVKPGKKILPALNLPGEIGKDHDNFRVHPRRKILHPAVEPCLIDLMHRRRRTRALGFVDDLHLIILFQAFPSLVPTNCTGVYS
jgi:hypothetical protein